MRQLIGSRARPDKKTSILAPVAAHRRGRPVLGPASVYFSFAQQQQNVPFSHLFANSNDFGNPSLPQVMQAEQEPVRATTYELGLQWSFEQHTVLDA